MTAKEAAAKYAKEIQSIKLARESGNPDNEMAAWDVLSAKTENWMAEIPFPAARQKTWDAFMREAGLS